MMPCKRARPASAGLLFAALALLGVPAPGLSQEPDASAPASAAPEAEPPRPRQKPPVRRPAAKPAAKVAKDPADAPADPSAPVAAPAAETPPARKPALRPPKPVPAKPAAAKPPAAPLPAGQPGAVPSAATVPEPATPAALSPPPTAEPPSACEGRAALYDGQKGFSAHVTRLGRVEVENPLRPLTPEVTRVLQLTIGGKAATAYGPDLTALRRGGSPAALESQLGGGIRWEPSLPLLPETLTIVSEAGEPLARLAFRACTDAPAVKAPPPQANAKERKPAARRPPGEAAAPKTPPGFQLPQGAIAQ